MRGWLGYQRPDPDLLSDTLLHLTKPNSFHSLRREYVGVESKGTTFKTNKATFAQMPHHTHTQNIINLHGKHPLFHNQPLTSPAQVTQQRAWGHSRLSVSSFPPVPLPTPPQHCDTLLEEFRTATREPKPVPSPDYDSFTAHKHPAASEQRCRPTQAPRVVVTLVHESLS